MTSAHNESHRYWDELAAAQALHALERSEQLLLSAHADTCPSCRDRMDEFALVAAQLGALADEVSEPPSWSALRGGLIQAASTGPPAAPLPLRRQLPRRLLASVAGVAVIAASVVVGSRVLGEQGSPSSAALTACRHQQGCRAIEMHGQHGNSAAVLVEAGHASLVPVDMPAPPPDRMYVLWQMPRDGSPIPVVSSRANRQTSSVPLTADYSDTAAFAVSLEVAGAMPTRPTDVLAVGAATG